MINKEKIMGIILDEKNDLWIKVYKILNLIGLIGWILIGLFGTVSPFYLDYRFFGFDSFIVWFLFCAVIGFFSYSLNMLFIQLLSNVNEIRRKLN